MKYVNGLKVVQNGRVNGRDVVCLEFNPEKGHYLMGPGPNGKYAVVVAGMDGCFSIAYHKALREDRFTEELSDTGEPDRGKPIREKLQVR